MTKQKIYVAGHKGMVGSALVRFLKNKKEFDLIIKDKSQLDLTDQSAVQSFFNKEKIDQVYIAAAKVGGIHANNNYPAEFIYKNLIIQINIIHSAFVNGIKKLLFLGSSCIYPKFANQPIKEEELLTGILEPTNEPYAIAKIAGIKMCESYNRQYGISHNIDYRSVMPTNLYGPNDNYNKLNSHVIPALIRKFHEAKIKKKSKVIIWGSGKQKREFLYVDDFAKACFRIMNLDKKILNKIFNNNFSHINVGFGSDLSIKELAEIIKKITNYGGKIEFDLTKNDGIKKKLLDSKHIFNLGWRPEVTLEDGLIKTYKDFQSYYENNFKNN